MEEEPIQSIRESSRNQLVLNRRKHRDEVADCKRSMNNLRTNPDTVLEISNKLKTKSAVSLSELQMLKNCLMDDAAHVEVVLNTHGALRGLVRELTGHDVNKQVAAAGCFCNLALGDSRACVAIVKAAGPYLIASLDSLTKELAITSAWTVGNLSGSGVKASSLLSAQGAVSKLTQMLDSTEEAVEAALSALVCIAHQLGDELRTEHLHKILDHLPRLNIADTSQLLFILSCHEEFSSSLITEDYLIKMLHYLHGNLEKSTDSNVTYIFRTFANVNCENVSSFVLNYFFSNHLDGVVRNLVVNGNEAVLWFLGNCLNCIGSDKVLIERLLHGL